MAEEDEYGDEEDPHWESEAQEAVQRAYEDLSMDEVRGVVEMPDPDEPRRSSECKDIEELKRALEAIYDTQWYGNVPFDSGEAVFEGDSEGYVSDFLHEHPEVEGFFESFEVRESEEESSVRFI